MTTAEQQRQRRIAGGPEYRALLAAKERARKLAGGRALQDRSNELARMRRARRNPPVPYIDRFFARVDATGDCWVWVGHTSEGYGSARYEGRPQGAHRIAYQLLVGPIPDGLHLDHLCRNRRCVNPAHVEPVTPVENLRRGYQHVAQRRRTACRFGHPYTNANTYWTPRQTRICRTCHQAGEARYQIRRRERQESAA